MTNFRFPRMVAATVATGFAICAATAYAFWIERDPKIAPDPPLPQAYDKAIEALGPDAKAFHCVAAGAGGFGDSSGPTEWHFNFYSADGSYREVIVPTKDKVIVRDHRRSTY